MGEKITGQTRNIIVYVFVLLTIVCLSVAIVLGGKQDDKYQADFQTYQTAQQQLQEGKFAEAEKSYQTLLASYPGSYTLLWKYALALAAQQKYKEADQYFLKAQKQRPFLVQNQRYLIQYGEVLYKLGNYKKAKKYLEEGRKLNKDPQLSAMAEPLLKEIDAKLKAKQ
ncbi:tetratricopeptide repeat protein [Aneurinibacillus thermoaerophilus]|uniref:tetratricopeptide repeat protein n=1 Tax=Aneurinibacillus thermoaerophilus TaxID=143495 RepID=UPI002E212BA7|nr:tetratricopeptide repeat protein [Aneurinibacillus thermoaerophilus]